MSCPCFFPGTNFVLQNIFPKTKSLLTTFHAQGGGLGVQVGLGCVQPQQLYNLADLGHPPCLLEPCFLICLMGAEFPPGGAIVGRRRDNVP